MEPGVDHGHMSPQLTNGEHIGSGRHSLGEALTVHDEAVPFCISQGELCPGMGSKPFTWAAHCMPHSARHSEPVGQPHSFT